MEKKERSDGGSSSSISLIDLVFSWSIQDVLNTNLYKALVKKIPETFKSTAEYLNSFLAPLIEETHADLFSSMTRLARAPSREVFSVERDKDYKAPRDLFYKIVLRRDSNGSDHLVTYQPQTGDLVALTNVRPDCISDLNGPKFSYLLAYVQAVDSDNVSILSSKPVMTEQKTLLGQRSQNISQQKHTLFFVFLINMTTNIRIWKALHPDLKGGNLKMINKVIEMNGADEEDCAMCLYQKNCVTVPSFKSYGLNDSQEAVIISCINSWCCNHQNTVKLVWGPPGTGKTKIAGLLLLSLLRMKCRTITCAPTNIAALEVTSRLMRLVAGTLEYDTYGFGDIVLFGNIERMRINDHEDLLDVFLDYRVEILDKCFSPLSGWKISLVSMINLLEDPQEQYGRYLANRGLGNSDANNEMENENCDENLKDTSRNPWKKVIMESSKQKETNKKQVTHENENHSKPEKEEDRYGASLEKTNAQEAETCMDDSITLEEFVKERFSVFNERLKFCTVNLYTHLPTQFISLELVKSMMMALDMLRSLETLFNCFNFGDEGFREALADTEKGSEVSDMAKLGVIRQNCLQILKSLPLSFSVPEFTQKFLINNFCLDNACLLFCTASSSSKLSTERTRPLDLLVIDEAAQLKECESTIPFQLPGLRHAVLIGDERQLPAVIHSKVSDSFLLALAFDLLSLSHADVINSYLQQISGKAKFGRSLFERLVLLGQKKQLLNVQYRMHPAISSFPNNEFYDGKILDAAIVKHRSHEKRFLHGNMYGAYSFINVASGKEQLDHLPGRKNMVEVAVVCKIVASLFNEFTGTKQRICIGVISPYKAQVLAIQEKLEKKYTGYADSGFAVSIATVDGFQGNEKDVVIVSTVRCNINGSVGFLSNRQRANVALTRARHCLWVLGNEATFVKSNSVWKKLVTDAKRRGCFFNADEDKHLAEAIVTTLIELEQFDTLLSMDSPLFKKARWRVCFSNDFWKSLASINNIESYKQMLNLLEKLSSGWRQTPDQQKNHIVVGGCFGLLEVYPVDDSLNLLWSVDIIKENSNFIQVLKVWDILPLMDIPKAERNLRILFGEYTENKISRCKYQCLEGNLVVPMKWEVEDSRTQGTGHGDESMESSSKYVPEFVENVHASGNINSFSFYLLGVVIVVIAFKFLMFKEN